jgi:AraC family transcriptional regulator, transcriptional activator of pobA
MKDAESEIKRVELVPGFHKEHKVDLVSSDFGLDNTDQLVEGGFGIYSTKNMKERIGPIKTEFFRVALIRSGTVQLEVGLEPYQPRRDSMVFGFPGQTFSLHDQQDFFAYYLLFRPDFMPESLLKKNGREWFPFFSYSGVQSFVLSPEEALEVEHYVWKINGEVKAKNADRVRAIQLYLQIIILLANRSYERQQLGKPDTATTGNALLRRFIKLVNAHCLTLRKVSDYADLLNVSADHLNRTIKSQSDKTAHQLIDEMILMEAKAHLRYTDLSIAEVAYQLEFTDPSHFNKFFKKLAGCTPLQFRKS